MRVIRNSLRLLVVASALVAAGVASAGPGDHNPVPPGDEGPIWSCGYTGRTWAGGQTIQLHPCMSYQTSFYGADDPHYCWAAGAYAYVVHVTQSYPTQYHIRWEGHICMNGTTYWSNAWGHNEYRYSQLNISNPGVYFAMNQWRY